MARRVRLLTRLMACEHMIAGAGSEIVVEDAEATRLLGAIGLAEDLGETDGSLTALAPPAPATTTAPAAAPPATETQAATGTDGIPAPDGAASGVEGTNPATVAAAGAEGGDSGAGGDTSPPAPTPRTRR